MTGTVLIESNSLFFHALAYFWRNIETCALKVFKCERLFVNSTALNLSHVAILMMTISFLKCAFFRTLNFLMYITCSLNSILTAKMHGPCREHNPQRNFTGPVTAPASKRCCCECDLASQSAKDFVGGILFDARITCQAPFHSPYISQCCA